MNVADTLEALRNKAMHDPSLKKAQEIILTRWGSSAESVRKLGFLSTIWTLSSTVSLRMHRCGAARMAEGRIRRCWMAKMMHMRFFCMSWSRAEMPERNFGGRFFFTCVECTGMI